MRGNPFTRHPNEVGESYFEHMGVATRVGLTMARGALGCFVHAVFPFLCVRTGSATIDRLHRQINKRVEAPNWERHPII
ncbi:MAG TPA: DUF6356 family protein [Allosphingosinicella sp.]|jgi:hypothetical protein